MFIKNELITKLLNTKTQVFYYKLKLHQFPTIHKKVYKKIIKFLKMLLKVFCLKHYLFISAHRCKIIFLRHFKSKTTALFKNIALCLKNKVKFIIVNFNAQNA